MSVRQQVANRAGAVCAVEADQGSGSGGVAGCCVCNLERHTFIPARTKQVALGVDDQTAFFVFGAEGD